MRQKVFDSPIGPLLLGADDMGICRIHLMKQGEESVEEQACMLLEQAAYELGEFFEGKRWHFDFPMSMYGSAFERSVWKALMEIPFGETRTYGQIAAQLGMPQGARAVGGACSRNPILIAVPCHRVVASNGALTGFAAGIQAKRSLLRLEGVEIQRDKLKR